MQTTTGGVSPHIALREGHQGPERQGAYPTSSTPLGRKPGYVKTPAYGNQKKD